MNYRDKLVLDKEVGTPLHDEMQLEFNKECAVKLLNILYPGGLKFRNYDATYFCSLREIDVFREKIENEIGNYENLDIYITSQGKFVWGPDTTEKSKQFFKNNSKQISKYLENKRQTFDKHGGINIGFEIPILSGFNSKFLVGIADAIITVDNKTDRKDYKFLIEFKTQINNFGDILRQMQVYKKYVRAEKYIIIYKKCINPKIIERLNEQGFFCFEEEKIYGKKLLKV